MSVTLVYFQYLSHFEKFTIVSANNVFCFCMMGGSKWKFIITYMLATCSAEASLLYINFFYHLNINENNPFKMTEIYEILQNTNHDTCSYLLTQL